MHIGIFAGYMIPHCGGYCTNIQELAERLVARGYEVTVITCNSEKVKSREWIDGVEVVRLPMLLHVGDALPIPVPVMPMRKFDVVVTQTRFFPTSVLGAVYSAVRGVPMIHVERGSCHTVLKSELLGKLTRVYDHTVGRWVMSRADRTVGISESACELITHLYPRASPVLVRNGVDLPSVSGNMERDDVYKIVFTGRLIYAKGVQDLIEAVCKVKGVGLTIVGDGGYRDTLEELVETLGIEGRVAFLGMVRHEEIPEILSGHDLFVNPSYSEGLPTTVMEAASVGLPIIATDVGDTNEIVRDGVSGLLVKVRDVEGLAERIEWMRGNREEALSMGESARMVVSKLSWDSITDQWEELLETIRVRRR